MKDKNKFGKFLLLFRLKTAGITLTTSNSELNIEINKHKYNIVYHLRKSKKF